MRPRVSERDQYIEEMGWHVAAFEDGEEARIVHEASVQANPYEGFDGNRWMARSWHAGWCDADAALAAPAEEAT